MRLDEYLTKNGFFDSRTKAKQSIINGEVIINGEKVDKPAKEISENDSFDIVIEKVENFVSLGGYKLSKALKDFGFSVKDRIVADIGASTGGFTDCLLQNGAKKVYAVDLNDDLLHASLKNNVKVRRIIKNAKQLTREDLIDIDLITADLSFISAKQVLDVFYRVLPDNGKVILLIKPQFEIGERRNFKNGIVKDDKIRKSACLNVYNAAIDAGFSAINMTVAPLNKDKNAEFLLLLAKNNQTSRDFDSLYSF